MNTWKQWLLENKFYLSEAVGLSFFTGSATSDNNESTFKYKDVILLMTTKTGMERE